MTGAVDVMMMFSYSNYNTGVFNVKYIFVKMVQRVGLKPTMPEDGRFTASCNSRYANAACGDPSEIWTREYWTENPVP